MKPSSMGPASRAQSSMETLWAAFPGAEGWYTQGSPTPPRTGRTPCRPLRDRLGQERTELRVSGCHRFPLRRSWLSKAQKTALVTSERVACSGLCACGHSWALPCPEPWAQ